MWKPGQLVTIYNKVYRVTKKYSSYRCIICAFKGYEEDVYPCNACLSYSHHNLKIPAGCHLEPIKANK